MAASLDEPEQRADEGDEERGPEGNPHEGYRRLHGGGRDGGGNGDGAAGAGGVGEAEQLPARCVPEEEVTPIVVPALEPLE